jgi:hypothetical protein
LRKLFFSSNILFFEPELRQYTGCFIMFFMTTNIYSKKTKGPTLLELFTATGKLKKLFFLQLDIFYVCTTRDTAHIDTIFKFLPHKRQHGCIDILYCCNGSVPLGLRGHLAILGRIPGLWRIPKEKNLCTKCTLHSNHKLTRVIIPTHKTRILPRAAIFLLHTLASHSGRNVNYDEKQLNGKTKIWVVPSICTCFVNTCRTVFL